MLNEADGSRRRELQRRAYSAGGGVSEAELAELRDLDARAALPGPDSTVSPEPAPPHDDPAPPHGDPVPVQDDPASGYEDVPPDPPASAEPAVAGRRRRSRLSIPILVLSVAVAVLLGVGVGWMSFGRADSRPAMTDAQRETLVQLDSSDEFDAGSVVLLGVKHGAEAWYATKDSAESECLVLVAADRASVGDDPGSAGGRQTACQKVDEPETFGLQANLALTIDGERVMIWAVVLDDAAGERATIIQREVMTDDDAYDWRSQYSGPELEIAEFLDASGYDGSSLQLVGWDDTMPIWMSFDGGQICMLVAEPTALIADSCAAFDTSKGARLDLGTDRGVYQLNVTQNVEPTLTIIRTPDSVVCDVDSGYCGVDDKTGETGG